MEFDSKVEEPMLGFSEIDFDGFLAFVYDLFIFLMEKLINIYRIQITQTRKLRREVIGRPFTQMGI